MALSISEQQMLVNGLHEHGEDALAQHIAYARFESMSSECVPPEVKFPDTEHGKRLHIDKIWNYVEGTLFLYPFMTLLVDKLKDRKGYGSDWKGIEYSELNWIGDLELVEDFVLAGEFYSRMTELSSSVPKRAIYPIVENGNGQLSKLKLVLNHFGSVVIKPMTFWLELRNIKEQKEREDKIKEMEYVLNSCSIKGIRAIETDGRMRYTTWYVQFSPELGFEIKEFEFKSEKLGGSIPTNFPGVGYWAMHKGVIVDELTSRQSETLLRFAEQQVEYMNEFIRNSK